MNYDNEFPSKFKYLPKIGGKDVFEIKTIRKVTTGNPQFHFIQKQEIELPDGKKAKTDNNLGYHIECDIQEDKVLSVTSIGAFLNVFKKNDIQPGDVVTIDHPEKGIWKVTKELMKK